MSADHALHWDPAIAALIEQAEKRGEARGRAEALQKAATAIGELDPPSYFEAPSYREGLVDGYGIAAAVCHVLATEDQP